MDWLETTAAWLYFDAALLWYLIVLVAIGALAFVESLIPAFAHDARREQRWPTNFGFAVVNTALVALIPLSAVLAAVWAQKADWGLLNQLPRSAWVSIVATVAIRSFVGYGFHAVLHKIPLLWRLHRVHHSDTHLDVSTALRSHPLELMLNILVMVSTAILFGLTPWVLVAYELVEAILNLITHANLRLPAPLDRALRLVLVTPNMHSLHHSSYQPETDSNYGTVFSIWDRLFGTYSSQPAEGYEGMQIGLESPRDERASDLLWQIASPRRQLY